MEWVTGAFKHLSVGSGIIFFEFFGFESNCMYYHVLHCTAVKSFGSEASDMFGFLLDIVTAHPLGVELWSVFKS